MFEHSYRQAVSEGVIKIIHQPTANQRADILTKPMGQLPFIYLRSVLLNQIARTVFDTIITRKSLHITNTLFFKMIKLTRACYIYNTRTFTVYTSHLHTFSPNATLSIQCSRQRFFSILSPLFESHILLPIPPPHYPCLYSLSYNLIKVLILDVLTYGSFRVPH